MLTVTRIVLLSSALTVIFECPPQSPPGFEPRLPEAEFFAYDTSGRSGVRSAFLSVGPESRSEIFAPAEGLAGFADGQLLIDSDLFLVEEAMRPAGMRHYFRVFDPEFGWLSGSAGTCAYFQAAPPRDQRLNPFLVVPMDGALRGWELPRRPVDGNCANRIAFSFVWANSRGGPSLGVSSGLIPDAHRRTVDVAIEYLPGNSLEPRGRDEASFPAAGMELTPFWGFSLCWETGGSGNFDAAPCIGPIRITTSLTGFEPDVVETSMEEGMELLYTGLLVPAGDGEPVLEPVPATEPVLRMALADMLAARSVPVPEWIAIPSGSEVQADRNGDGVRDGADLISAD